MHIELIAAAGWSIHGWDQQDALPQAVQLHHLVCLLLFGMRGATRVASSPSLDKPVEGLALASEGLVVPTFKRCLWKHLLTSIYVYYSWFHQTCAHFPGKAILRASCPRDP